MATSDMEQLLDEWAEEPCHTAFGPGQLARGDRSQASTRATPLRQQFNEGLEATPQQAVAYYTNLTNVGMRYFIIGCWPGDTETMRLFSQRVLPALS